MPARPPSAPSPCPCASAFWVRDPKPFRRTAAPRHATYLEAGAEHALELLLVPGLEGHLLVEGGQPVHALPQRVPERFPGQHCLHAVPCLHMSRLRPALAAHPWTKDKGKRGDTVRRKQKLLAVAGLARQGIALRLPYWEGCRSDSRAQARGGQARPCHPHIHGNWALLCFAAGSRHQACSSSTAFMVTCFQQEHADSWLASLLWGGL